MSKHEALRAQKATGVDAAAAFEALEHILQAQLDLHRHLEKSLRAKEAAIRSADVASMMDCCETERAIAAKISELERRRAGLIRALLAGRPPADQKSPRLADVLKIGEDDQQQRLSALGGELRETVARVKQISGVVRDAATSLARHMAGVMQSVRSALGPTKVYSRRGHVARGAPMQFTVDLKS